MVPPSTRTRWISLHIAIGSCRCSFTKSVTTTSREEVGSGKDFPSYTTALRRNLFCTTEESTSRPIREPEMFDKKPVVVLDGPAPSSHKIGRASCRERV